MPKCWREIKKGFGATGKKIAHLSRPHLGTCGHGRGGPFHVHTYSECGRGRGPFHVHTHSKCGRGRLVPFHDHTFKCVDVEGDPSTTTYTNVVVKDLRLDSYLHVMPPRFSSTTNIGFLVVNYGREKPIF